MKIAKATKADEQEDPTKAKEEEEGKKATDAAKGPNLEGSDHNYRQEVRGKNADYLKVCSTILGDAAKADPENADAVAWALDFLSKYDEMMEMADKSKGDADSDSKFKESTKSMSGARIAELKAAHNSMGALLTTIGALKAEEEEEDETKADKQKAAAMGESVGAEVAKAMAPVAEVLKSLQARLETVETTRGAARGEDGDGTPVKKGEESLFGGLFS